MDSQVMKQTQDEMNQVDANKDETGKSQSSQQLSMRDYSDRSFVVLGNSKPFSNTFKNMGGRFNRYLTVDGQKVVGWVFSKNKQEEVATFLLQANSGETPTNQSFALPTNNEMQLPTVNPPRGANQHYQTVHFKIYRPREGMKVSLKTEGAATMHGKVIRTESTDDVVDAVYIDFGTQTTFACICRGKWQVFGFNPKHSLFFLE